MTLKEAKVLARQGIKMKHEYFTSDEYMTMRGNIVVFEDGVKTSATMFWHFRKQEYWNDGWEEKK